MFKSKFKSKSKFNYNSFKNVPVLYKILVGACCVVVSVFSVYLFTWAGTITSPGDPASAGRMYTLEQIYQKLYNGAVTAKQSVFTEPGSAPGSTMHTLDDIYGDFTTDATSCNGTTAADVLSGKTFFATSGTTRGTNWGPVAGSIANCSEGGNTCYAPSGYWTATSGSDVTVTSSSGTAIPTGYYSGKTCSAALTGGTGSVAAAGQILSTYHAWGATGAVIQGSGAAYGIPKTGQTAESVDYDDGHYQSGKPTSGTHYQLNADTITITDNATGLMWLKDPSLAGGDTYPNTWASALNTPTTMTWANAITNCEALTYAGYDDWRLPNSKELQSIVNYGNWSPAIGEATLGGSGTRAPWVNTQSSYYWSSTTNANDTSYAWSVYFYIGHVKFNDKTINYYVRCVRQ